MSAVSGAAGFQTAFESSLSADLAHLGMQVTPENIVQISNALRAESDYLKGELTTARRESLVGEPGHDPVSPKAATGFNAKVHALYDQVEVYCATLRSMSDDLDRTAQTYGHTEDDIRRSLDSVKVNYGQSPLPLPLASASAETPLLAEYGPRGAVAPTPPRNLSPMVNEPGGWWEPLGPVTGTQR